MISIRFSSIPPFMPPPPFFGLQDHSLRSIYLPFQNAQQPLGWCPVKDRKTHRGRLQGMGLPVPQSWGAIPGNRGCAQACSRGLPNGPPEQALSAAGKGQHRNLMFSHILNGFQRHWAALLLCLNNAVSCCSVARGCVLAALCCGFWKPRMQLAKPN